MCKLSLQLVPSVSLSDQFYQLVEQYLLMGSMVVYINTSIGNYVMSNAYFQAELGITRYKSNMLRNNYYFYVEKVI